LEISSLQFLTCSQHQPEAELADAGGGEIGLELFQTAEIFADFLFQADPAICCRRHWASSSSRSGQMVVMLAGIVEHGRVLAETIPSRSPQGICPSNSVPLIALLPLVT